MKHNNKSILSLSIFNYLLLILSASTVIKKFKHLKYKQTRLKYFNLSLTITLIFLTL